MIRGFRQIALLTIVSRIFGFIRDITFSHFFGAGGLLDAWIIAFRIPNLARRLFGEGAASASFIPVYSEQLAGDRDRAANLANTMITTIFVLLAGVVLVGEVVIWCYYKFFANTSETQLVLSLTSVMLPYMVLVCTVAILGGILNVHRHFAAPAAAPVVLNIFIIASILLTGWLFGVPARQQPFYVALAVIVAGCVQLGMQIPPLRRAGVKIRPAWHIYSSSFKKVIFLMGPMIIGLTVTQINTLADDLIAWWFSGSAEKGYSFFLMGNEILFPLKRGSVSYLYYSQRLYQLPLGVLGISLATAVFPVMSSYAASRDYSGLSRAISSGIRSSVFMAVPAIIGLVFVGKPLISVAFEHGKFSSQHTDMVALTLFFYSLGLCGYFGQQVLTRAFYSMQDSRVPMRSALAAVLVNVVLNLTLLWPLGTAGLAASTAICSYLQVIILLTALLRRLDSSILAGFSVTVCKTLICSAFMSVVLLVTWWLSKTSCGILRLLTMVPAGAIAYLFAARLLAMKELSLLTRGRKAVVRDEKSS